MEWKGRRESGNVEDARGQSSGGFGGGGGGGLGLLMTIGRIFGIKGILAAVVVGAVLWKMGIVDPGMLLGGGPSTGSSQRASNPEDDERVHFVKVVMGETEDVWTAEFARHGRKYEQPAMKVYTGQTRTACGTGSAAMGPFYCPGDQVVYIDLSFYDELAKTFKSPGDFAQAYVVAHEVGHHVQKLLGTSDKVAAMQGRPDYNEYSVRLELQADYYAGVWANHSKEDLKLDNSDIEEAMTAANAIGDDMIQKQMQGRVTPKAFTHGTAAQRMRWFKKGLDSGRIEDGDTFSMPYKDL
ncbi:MAG: neutral zinc metallopeptidase [Luteolibacter sp.]|uniref:KPN_02809 family neutral zinc metallopeptidase n=1 Tax=Luteolibacter sp. TaxID=1962973 RepID=UPI00326518C2